MLEAIFVLSVALLSVTFSISMLLFAISEYRDRSERLAREKYFGRVRVTEKGIVKDAWSRND